MEKYEKLNEIINSYLKKASEISRNINKKLGQDAVTEKTSSYKALSEYIIGIEGKAEFSIKEKGFKEFYIPSKNGIIKIDTYCRGTSIEHEIILEDISEEEAGNILKDITGNTLLSLEERLNKIKKSKI